MCARARCSPWTCAATMPRASLPVSAGTSPVSSLSLSLSLSLRSPASHSSYTLKTLVEDVRAFISAVSGNKRVYLVAHDWGGVVAWCVPLSTRAAGRGSPACSLRQGVRRQAPGDAHQAHHHECAAHGRVQEVCAREPGPDPQEPRALCARRRCCAAALLCRRRHHSSSPPARSTLLSSRCHLSRRLWCGRSSTRRSRRPSSAGRRACATRASSRPRTWPCVAAHERPLPAVLDCAQRRHARVIFAVSAPLLC